VKRREIQLSVLHEDRLPPTYDVYPSMEEAEAEENGKPFDMADFEELAEVLSHMQLQVLYGLTIGGMSERQYAEATGMPKSNVHYHIKTAKERMRNARRAHHLSSEQG
jgi:DNA-directed RNA polymerase specialized sigma24 family protein